MADGGGEQLIVQRSTCSQCGGELKEGLAFCTNCGTKVDTDSQQDSAPEGDTQQSLGQQGLELPPWVTAGWAVAGVAIVGIVFAVVLVSVAYGAIVGGIVEGSEGEVLDGVVEGARLGLYLAFTVTGATVEAGSTTMGFTSSFLPITLTAFLWVVASRTTAFAVPRLPDDRASRIVFVLKVAVGSAVAVSLAGAALTLDSGADFQASIDIANAGIVTGLVVLAASLWRLAKLGTFSEIGVALSARLAPVRLGLVAFLLAAVLSTGVALGVATYDATPADGVLMWALLPFLGLNLLLSVGLFIQGAAVGYATADQQATSLDQPMDDHMSVFHLGIVSDGASPGFLVAVLVVVPIALGILVYRHLSKRQVSSEQQALRVGFAATVGLILTNVVAAVIGQVGLSGDLGSYERSGGFVITEQSMVAAIGLGAIWGLIGGLGAALLWSRIHRADKQDVPEDEQDMPADQPAAESKTCDSCGSAQRPTAAFCSSCGSELVSS